MERKKDYLNLSQSDLNENKEFADVIQKKKITILIFKIVVAICMLVFILTALFLPIFKSNVQLINTETKESKWEKTYNYSFIAYMSKGPKQLIGLFIDSLKKTTNSIPESIEITEKEDLNENYYSYVASIKNDEKLILKEVSSRKKEYKKAFLRRQHMASWVNFTTEMIEKKVKNQSDKEIKKFMIEQHLEREKHFIHIFLPEIESGNIVGLKYFLSQDIQNEDTFNELAGKYLVGNYEYSEEKVKDMLAFADFEFYDSSTISKAVYSGPSDHYWEKPTGNSLIEIFLSFVFITVIIILTCCEISLVVSLVKICLTKSISSLNLFNSIYKFLSLLSSIFLLIIFLVFKNLDLFDSPETKCLPTYSVLGIMMIIIAIVIMVCTIIHNIKLKNLKKMIDNTFNQTI